MANADTNKCTCVFLQIAENLYVYSYFDDPLVNADTMLFKSVRIYRAKEETTSSQWFASRAHNEQSPYRPVILADILILGRC